MLELVLWSCLAGFNMGPFAPEQFRPDFYECPRDHPNVCLADAYNFRATYEAAYAIAAQAHTHRNELRPAVRLLNLEWVYEAWEREADWRWTAWDDLKDALDRSRPKGSRLYMLERLKKGIGEEMFYAGIMPKPDPHYHIADR